MKDVELIIDIVTAVLPNEQWHQLRVKHPADDGGSWLFDLPEGRNSVQIESSSGMCPFLMEHDLAAERYHGATVEEVSDKVVEWLEL